MSARDLALTSFPWLSDVLCVVTVLGSVGGCDFAGPLAPQNF